MTGRALRWLLALGVPRHGHARGPARLTIVRHHRVYADGARPLYRLGVTESVLARQVEACHDAGLLPIGVREGLEWLRAAGRGHRVAFTFDDGYADNATRAVPVLARLGARATFYLAAGLMDERRAPWWDELAHALEHGRAERAAIAWGGARVAVERATPAGRAAALRALLPLLRVPLAEQRARLAALREALGVTAAAPCELATWEEARAFAEAGMEAGAHTLNHPFLTLLPRAEQAREMGESAALIRTRLGADVTGIAYPNGDHDARTAETARECGFAYAVTTQPGDCGAGTAGLTLPRRPLTEGGCLGPGGRFSARMTLAEVRGDFDRLRGRGAEAAS